MTISPTQLEINLKRKSAQELQVLEERIDNLLKEGVKQNGNLQTSIYIEASKLTPCSKFTIQQLLDKYQQAGWSITKESDQREGDYYIFQVKNCFRSASVQRGSNYSQDSK